MKIYADTNFFTAALANVENKDAARASIEGLLAEELAPLPVTWLFRLEFINAMQRLIHEARHGKQGIRTSHEMTLLAEYEFFVEMRNEGIWAPVEISPFELETRFEALARRYTAREGFRTYDILHVASAQALGCEIFWSFDRKAQKLAALSGMQTN
jgi:predicted nucleic acid-binding protein